MEPNIPPVQPPTPGPVPEQKTEPKKSLPKWPLMIVSVILLATLLTGAYLLGKNQIVNQKSASKTVQAIAPTVTPTPNPTANWKTYSNSNYNFSFQYPSDWTVVDNSKGESFTISAASPKGLMLNFSTNIWGVGGRCDQDTSHDMGNAPFSFMGLDTNMFFFGSKTNGTISFAYLLENHGSNAPTPCPNIAFFDVKSVGGINQGARGGLESVNISYADKASVNASNFKTSSDFSVAKQILSTFKPLSSTEGLTPTTTPAINEMANWKTYIDTDYPFQIKYPNEWTLRTTYGNSVKNVNNDRVAGIDINTGTPGYGSVLVVNIIDPKGKSLEDWLRLNMSNAYIPTKTTFQGSPAYRYSFPTQSNRLDTIEIYYQYKDKIIFLAWNLISGVDQPTADQIMSSLKFAQ